MLFAEVLKLADPRQQASCIMMTEGYGWWETVASSIRNKHEPQASSFLQYLRCLFMRSQSLINDCTPLLVRQVRERCRFNPYIAPIELHHVILVLYLYFHIIWCTCVYCSITASLTTPRIVCYHYVIVVCLPSYRPVQEACGEYCLTT